jgi:putative lipoprotein (rSAM/lipoprotein system)
MKAKMLTRINALIAFLLGILGFNSCEKPGRLMYGPPVPDPDPDVVVEYGVPYTVFEAGGRVSDEQDIPVENIRVQVKNKWGEQLSPDLYTNEEGAYYMRYEDMPMDSVDIIVTDTADVYAPDSVRVKVELDPQRTNDDDPWFEGYTYAAQDFRLKKKE